MSSSMYEDLTPSSDCCYNLGERYCNWQDIYAYDLGIATKYMYNNCTYYSCFCGSPYQTSDICYTLPCNQGNSGQVLMDSDGCGTLCWATPSSGPTYLCQLCDTYISNLMYQCYGCLLCWSGYCWGPGTGCFVNCYDCSCTYYCYCYDCSCCYCCFYDTYYCYCDCYVSCYDCSTYYCCCYFYDTYYDNYYTYCYFCGICCCCTFYFYDYYGNQQCAVCCVW